MPANGFVWYELVTGDVDAALRFYSDVVGWTAQQFPGTSERYFILNANGKGVGGVMALPAGMSQPFWMSYIGVSDIDAAVAKVTGAGGTLERQFDIPDVGRIALATDPQGAGLAMIQGSSGQPSEAFDTHKIGHVQWNELHTSDWERAWDFYAPQFGWEKGTAMDMGPMGTYQIIVADGVEIGAMFNSPNVPRPVWVPYFGVDDVDDVAKRMKGAGATIVHGPSEVPDNRFIIQALDPQKALFAVVGGRS